MTSFATTGVIFWILTRCPTEPVIEMVVQSCDCSSAMASPICPLSKDLLPCCLACVSLSLSSFTTYEACSRCSLEETSVVHSIIPLGSPSVRVAQLWWPSPHLEKIFLCFPLFFGTQSFGLGGPLSWTGGKEGWKGTNKKITVRAVCAVNWPHNRTNVWSRTVSL